MAAAALGIFSHAMTAGQALTGPGATPAAAATGTGSTSSSTGSASSSSATISANDFLTLLVTEMQNQDPTADTDPNEYINQLVQVNSLEQLIDINQNLTTALGGSSTSGTGTSGATPAAASALSGTSLSGASALSQNSPSASALTVGGTKLGTSPTPAGTGAAVNSSAPAVGAMHGYGNFSLPEANPAALQVARALDGRSHKHASATGVAGTQ